MIESKIITVDKTNCENTNSIEAYIFGLYGSVVRWAIIDSNDTQYTLCISYESRN